VAAKMCLNKANASDEKGPLSRRTCFNENFQNVKTNITRFRNISLGKHAHWVRKHETRIFVLLCIWSITADIHCTRGATEKHVCSREQSNTDCVDLATTVILLWSLNSHSCNIGECNDNIAVRPVVVERLCQARPA